MYACKYRSNKSNYVTTTEETELIMLRFNFAESILRHDVTLPQYQLIRYKFCVQLKSESTIFHMQDKVLGIY